MDAEEREHREAVEEVEQYPVGAGVKVRARRRVATLGATFAIGLAIGLCGGLALDRLVFDKVGSRFQSEPQSSVRVTTEEAAVTAEPAPTVAVYYVPKPEDFQLDLVVLEKKCFGSAGCNVTFRIKDVRYSGEALEPGSEWDVIYEVQGGTDPYRNKFVVTASGSDSIMWSVDREELIDTPSSSTVLKAVVVDVAKVR